MKEKLKRGWDFTKLKFPQSLSGENGNSVERHIFPVDEQTIEQKRKKQNGIAFSAIMRCANKLPSYGCAVLAKASVYAVYVWAIKAVACVNPQMKRVYPFIASRLPPG